MTAPDDGLEADQTPADAMDTIAEVDATEPSEPSSVPIPMARHRSNLGLTAVIAAVVLVLDQWSKRWALNALADGRSRHVIWTLDWNLTFNSGMAFSRAQGIGPYIGAVAFIVVIVMLLSLRRSGGTGSAVAVGLVVGGALGNLTDRLFREEGWLRGRVVDFIDLNWWPIFNIADIGVSIGGVLLLVAAAFESRKAPR